MGEVVRAHDTNLNRDVALKVLPPAFAADTDRLARFKREAQVLAALNHPHIAAIYGFEASDDAPALVLEFVDGPTLADRIAQGALPLDESLRIARQITDALEAAHEQRIIHRDLKPANIKVRADGTVKVLDFGLAKVFEPPPATTDGPSLLPTITSPALTRMGVIMGTAAYMSPEQARGQEVDRRTDVWAFGCVLYEMLTGVRPFTGDDTTDTIAAIVRAHPDWSRLPPHTPASVRRLLRRCLEKDRARRIADIRDVRLEIDDAREAEPEAMPAPDSSRRRERLMWAAVVVVLAIAGAAAVSWRTGDVPVPPFEVHAEITTPPTTEAASLAISPDGRKLVYVASFEGRPMLWLRWLETGVARPVRGSEGGTYPFWSPDSQSFAFFAAERLYRTSVDGGVPRIITAAAIGVGGTWNRDGTILFTPVPDAPILRVSADGGSPQPTGTMPRTPAGYRFPQFLPDGRHFLYYVQESRGVFLGSLDNPETSHLFDADAAATFMPPGQVLFVRERKLFAQPFDLGRLQPIGQATVQDEAISVDPRGAAAISASAVGTLVYRTGSGEQQRTLAWFDRSGNQVEIAAAPDGSYPMNPSLSPDDRFAALSRSIEGNTDIWLLDLTRTSSFIKFTSDAVPEIVPVWANTGDRILFSKGAFPSGFVLRARTTTDSAKETEIATSIRRAIMLDVSSDGRFILIRTNDRTKSGWDIWALPTTTGSKPFPVLQEDYDERQARFSPDASSIVYESNETGQYEIYAQPFPGPGRKQIISTNGGSQPQWRRDGREVFYIAADGHLMAADVRESSSGQPRQFGAATPLFQAKVESWIQGGIAHTYAPARDGKRFLMSTFVEQPVSPIKLILHRGSR
jgi:Tol biopolymer transport system component